MPVHRVLVFAVRAFILAADFTFVQACNYGCQLIMIVSEPMLSAKNAFVVSVVVWCGVAAAVAVAVCWQQLVGRCACSSSCCSHAISASFNETIAT